MKSGAEIRKRLEALRDEIQEKRDWHNQQSIKKGSKYHAGMAQAYNDCLKELRGVLDDSDGDGDE